MTHLSVPQMILESHFLLGLPWPHWSLPYPISHPQPWPWAITFLFSVFFFFFWPQCKACGILVLGSGQWRGGVLTTGQPGSSLLFSVLLSSFSRIWALWGQEFLCLAATRPAQPKNKYINLKYTNSNLDKMGRDRNVFQMKESDKM